MTAGKCTTCYNAVKAQSHYDAGEASVRDQASTGMNRGSTGMNRCSNGMKRARPGTTRSPTGNYKNVKYLRDEPGVTGKDRKRPAWHRKLP
ncbi:hypothetical protein DPMN_107892 [Dreissena polymorpha]|uniref:Uncharacterized protein n=1 Tax=Dreissena polymorpha TaxID=45954 RepID=A0A9D4K7J2_DREPO|nr:hypothetical protein DPMN_107892 [Dreissena polymorpha]